ncbi:hypothetical protein BHM03_00001500 [Ensete ventricosum]|nr:hypothetical protein BHM03_00001500 [Ensete ventricosum]
MPCLLVPQAISKPNINCASGPARPVVIASSGPLHVTLTAGATSTTRFPHLTLPSSDAESLLRRRLPLASASTALGSGGRAVTLVEYALIDPWLLYGRLEKREAANQRTAKSLEQVFSVKLTPFSPYLLVLTCIYAACKVEENHVSAEELGKGIQQDHQIILNNEMVVYQEFFHTRDEEQEKFKVHPSAVN